VDLESARLVIKTFPWELKMWQENARWRGVSVLCTVALSAVPISAPLSSKRITSSEVFMVFSRYCAKVILWRVSR
jgi:hypothetical protein